MYVHIVESVTRSPTSQGLVPHLQELPSHNKKFLGSNCRSWCHQDLSIDAEWGFYSAVISSWEVQLGIDVEIESTKVGIGRKLEIEIEIRKEDK